LGVSAYSGSPADSRGDWLAAQPHRYFLTEVTGVPIYDFTCSECGEQFEALVLRHIANPEAPACPKCKSQKLEQEISTFAVDSDHTRQQNLRGAKAKNARLRKDYQIAQAEHEREHRH
jgi:putative FmdB family regulatory protein